MERITFPFTAVLGQEKIKNALLWNIVNPKIGGVLISGDKGTAKSTLVRGLSEITNRNITELPLNTTEDRLIGSIDFEKAIKYGVKTFESGILYKANKGILYVDEVNLLSDNIAKALLDVASSGTCRVEREGISYVHESEFVMIGSMNPEEGGLRPQFIDRFGLYVEVAGEQDLDKRIEIIDRRLKFEGNPLEFIESYKEEQTFIKEEILEAIAWLPKVQVGEEAMKLAAQISKDGFCAGHRAELVIVETAKAIAALAGHFKVEHENIIEASKYALPHRMRAIPELPQNPQDEDQENSEEEQNQEEQNQEDQNQEEQNQEDQNQEDQNQEDQNQEEQNQEEQNQEEQNQKNFPELPPQFDQKANNQKDTVEMADGVFDVVKWLEFKSKIAVNHGSGRRSLVRTNLSLGRYVKSKSANGKMNSSDIAFDATLRAAAPFQSVRDKKGMAFCIVNSDMKIKQREKRTGNYILFVVDASGSMGAAKRMKTVKNAILSLLGDAYQKRDKVGMVMFKNQTAEIILDMTRSVDLAQKKLQELPTGGKTPLCFGIETAHNAIKTALYKDKEILPVIVLISDGRATFGRGKKPFDDAVESARAVANDKIRTVVIDAEQDFIKLGLAQKIAQEMNGDYIKLNDLKAETLVNAVGTIIN